MNMRSHHAGEIKNKLLAGIPREELEAISPDLVPVKLEFRQELHQAFQPIERVYFVTSGVVSLVNEPEAGDAVEFATLGREGMVGFPVILGATSIPSVAFVQVPGEAMQIPAAQIGRAHV